MIGLLRGFGVDSGLSAYLRGEIEKRGWDDVDLARRAGIDKGSLSYILNNPDAEPRLTTLRKLASGLGVPLRRLLVVMGIEVEEEDNLLDAERVAALLDAIPELQEVVDNVSQFPPDEIRAFLAYIDAHRRRHRS